MRCHLNVEIADRKFRASLWYGIFLVCYVFIETGFPIPSSAQQEGTTAITRLRDREAGSRYYEKYEAKPRSHLPIVNEPMPRKALVTLAPSAERVRIRKYLVDAHVGLRFYNWRTCVSCHPREARNLHGKRVGITCYQCHGGEPISGSKHYYSPMNQRRRYAFVCAKCHRGSSASFARYVIHPPSPVLMSTIRTFPVLFYVFWGMVVIAVGTFVVFLPHTIAWGIREIFTKKEKSNGESREQN